ncbi:hypothetical protein [Sphaerisporangium dianthi]|uniref:META domain-containing protein n=1 Tax=Sphaerisporangium dianthi TaxID=1436120 RepID=A0ABV9CBM8_9ACTN
MIHPLLALFVAISTVVGCGSASAVAGDTAGGAAREAENAQVGVAPAAWSRAPDAWSRPSSGEATVARGAAKPRIPKGLVGKWEAASGDATLAFGFGRSGRYRQAWLLSYPTAAGTVEFFRYSEGKARVRGNRLTLTPSKVTSTRRDPNSPHENYTNRKEPLTPLRYTMRLSRTTLRLVDPTGLKLTFTRQR